MSVASVGSGTQTATIDTEHVLDTETSAGVYVLKTDCSNMAAGDIVELSLYSKYASGGTERLERRSTLSYAMVKDEPIVASLPLTTDCYCKATLQQTDGTGRDFYWSLLKIA